MIILPSFLCTREPNSRISSLVKLSFSLSNSKVDDFTFELS